MPVYRFTITRDTTESATVEIEADSIGEAHDEAFTWRVVNSAKFEPDDCVNGDVYIPDPSDYEIVKTRKPVVGTTQLAVLGALIGHESWRGSFSGWIWGTPGETRRIMDTLVKEGLAKVDGGVYTPTQPGIDFYNSTRGDNQ